MTHQDLDHLFMSARNVHIETSATEIASWVGTAAVSSTGVLGVAAKLKLFIAKKSIIMIASALSVIGVSTLLFITSPEVPIKKDVISTENLVQQRTTEISEMDKVDEPIVTSPITVPSTKEKTINLSSNLVKLESLNPVILERSIIRKEIIQKEFKEAELLRIDQEVSAFNKLIISGKMKIVLTQGEKGKIEFETTEELKEKVKLTQKGKSIFLQGSLGEEDEHIVYITVKNLEHVTLNGNSEISTVEQIQLKSLKFITSGNSSVSLDLQLDEFELICSGKSDIDLSGTVQDFKCVVSGNTEINAKEFAATNLYFVLSGKGESQVKVLEELKVVISGSGNVSYIGDPQEKSVVQSGSGTVIKL